MCGARGCDAGTKVQTLRTAGVPGQDPGAEMKDGALSARRVEIMKLCLLPEGNNMTSIALPVKRRKHNSGWEGQGTSLSVRHFAPSYHPQLFL